MSKRLTIQRIFASILLLLQLALPYAQAQAAANGTDLSQLICNPSGQPVSAEGKAALSDLLEALGAPDGNSDDLSIGDCDRCVTPNVALPSANASIANHVRYDRLTHSPKPSNILTDSAPSGPPCGLRAPPTFI